MEGGGPVPGGTMFILSFLRSSVSKLMFSLDLSSSRGFIDSFYLYYRVCWLCWLALEQPELQLTCFEVEYWLMLLVPWLPLDPIQEICPKSYKKKS